jgi:hypothetical protein
LAPITYHQGVGGHVPEALVLSRDEHRYEGNQVAEQADYEAQQCPYPRAIKAGNLAVVLPYHLYPENHLAHGLPQVAFQEEDVLKDDDHPVEQSWKHRDRTVPVCEAYTANGPEVHGHDGEQGTEDQPVDDGGQDPPACEVDVLVDAHDWRCNSSLSSHFLTSS